MKESWHIHQLYNNKSTTAVIADEKYLLTLHNNRHFKFSKWISYRTNINNNFVTQTSTADVFYYFYKKMIIE